MDISQLESVELLTQGEKDICSQLRIYPKAYLMIKDAILREYASKGFLKMGQAKSLVKLDEVKLGRLYSFWCENGWIKPVVPF